MSKPSPEELGSPRYQNQMTVSCYLQQVEILELQLKVWAMATDEELDILEWKPHPHWNWPIPMNDEIWYKMWERMAYFQQRQHREPAPDSMPKADQVLIAKETDVVENVGDEMIQLQSDQESSSAIATGKAIDQIEMHKKPPNQIVRSY